MFQTRFWATAAAVGVSIALPGVSAAATLNVPGDFATIQACINAAVSGVDECVVAPGTYHETINFHGKAITLRSSGGAGVTTIDATGIGGSVVRCTTGEGPDTVLDGFTITGGTGTRFGGYTHGGGMHNAQSSPTVTGCAFSENTAVYGGGMGNYSSMPTVTDCAFRRNIGEYGGGMSNEGSGPTVLACTFSENTAVYGGGMGNYDSIPTVTDCAFRGNAADFYGGGMYNEHSPSTVTYCTFGGNTAWRGGGMYNRSYYSPTVTNSIFNTNEAEAGGGMYNEQSGPAVINSTFSGNTAREDLGNSGGGGGMYNYAGVPGLLDCILWGDSPDEIRDVGPFPPWLFFTDVQGGLPVGAIDGGGNIDLNPMFVRPPDPGPDGTWDGVNDDYGDLRLQAASPCINAGDPGFVPQPGETDLEGHARVLCGRVDMGAYEFGIGDYDCDQGVDLADFSSWQACMTAPSHTDAFQSTIDIRQSTIRCEAFDFDGDGDVDLLDFDSFQGIFKP